MRNNALSPHRSARIWIAAFERTNLLVTALNGHKGPQYLLDLRDELQKLKVPTFIAGVDGDADRFRDPGKVTLSNIFRAKGNEAVKVYVTRLQYGRRTSWSNESEVQKRNEAFVALTRARIWCQLTGIHDPIFEEMEQAYRQYHETGALTFPVFNQNTLQHVLNVEEQA